MLRHLFPARYRYQRNFADNEGFKVADSRLPVAPTYNPEPLTAPEDTPEVVEARDAHMKAWQAALEAANDANDDEN